jgi:hypothetical protein
MNSQTDPCTINPLKHSDYCMYHNIKKLRILSIECAYVFHMILRIDSVFFFCKQQ